MDKITPLECHSIRTWAEHKVKVSSINTRETSTAQRRITAMVVTTAMEAMAMARMERCRRLHVGLQGLELLALDRVSLSTLSSHTSAVSILTLTAAQEMATPSQHRTRLGPLNQPAGRPDPSDYRSSNNMMFGSSQNQTPSQRQPFGNLSGNSINRPSMSGYGMSAGMKVGRQQGNGMSFVLG